MESRLEGHEKHESFGMISISKFSGNGSQFFGSDLIHNNGISFTISRGSVQRKLNQEWYHGEEQLITIELSPNQFVDAITSGMNTSGVPCTIKTFNGKRTEQIDFVKDKQEVFHTEMKETQEELVKRLEAIYAKINSAKLGVKIKEDLLGDIKTVANYMQSNTKFVLKQFKRAMGKTVSEAKHSISNYIDQKVNKLGIEGLRKELNIKLPEPRKD